MGLNSGIDTEPPWVNRTPLPVRVQKDFFDVALKDRGGYFDQYGDIIKIVRAATPASLIYFFCHGTAKELNSTKRRANSRRTMWTVVRTIRAGRSFSSTLAMPEIFHRSHFIHFEPSSANARPPELLRRHFRFQRCSLRCSEIHSSLPIASVSWSAKRCSISVANCWRGIIPWACGIHYSVRSMSKLRSDRWIRNGSLLS